MTAMALFYEDVLVALRDAGVHYVLVGGTAVILHGVPRTTMDLDLVVDLDSANLTRLVAVMNRLGFTPRAPVAAAELKDPARRAEWIAEKGMRAFTFQRPGHVLDEIDVLIDSPLDFAALAKNAEQVHAGGLMLRVAAIEDLIRMKELAGREQDIADIEALGRLLEARRHG